MHAFVKYLVIALFFLSSLANIAMIERPRPAMTREVALGSIIINGALIVLIAHYL